ncbi:C4-dicarboxylate ABC transporter permease [Billgrantia desiderata SP1]|uniref:TRAP transporter small permease n=1 Tax=Billgrantia desiderata TaxID=52021 RepID=UPI000A3B9EBB|nr:TRAP transporter small permease [Halomonas desiderata]OUE44446.1 C4-dicarboxylate ABC transporter permease [Halomonas desiderata SP1]
MSRNPSPKAPSSPPVEPEIDFNVAFDDDDFRFRDYAVEDYVTLVVFWALIFVVFLQFFTRYVLGDSTTWTEEIARYLLILVGFIGSVMAVRRGTHIMVEFFYHYMPGWLSRLLNVAVEIASIAFYTMLAWITFKLAGRTGGMMISVDVPKSVLYYAVCAAFVLMAVRGLQRLVSRVLAERRQVSRRPAPSDLH